MPVTGLSVHRPSASFPEGGLAPEEGKEHGILLGYRDISLTPHFKDDKMVYPSGSLKRGPGTSGITGIMLEMQILGLQPRPAESATLWWVQQSGF